MTTSFASETELLTEHFGYPPVSLLDDIINSVNILAERALNSVEQGLLNAPPAALGFKPPKSQDAIAAESQPPAAERAKSEVEAGTHQLETLLCASIDRDFDKFELYVLRNIFTVRPPELCNWIRLSHYEGLDFSKSSSSSSSRRNIDTNINNGESSNSSSNATSIENGNNHSSSLPADTPTIESITTLRRRLRESMRLNALLTAERARNDALLEDLRRLLGDPAATGGLRVKTESASPTAAQGSSSAITTNGPGHHDGEDAKPRNPFAFLHQKADLASSGGGAAPLATTAEFTLSQMQALRSLSTALSNLLPDLKPSASAAGDPKDEEEDGEGREGRGAAGSSSSSRSWRRERAEYVEAATRRHLETMHGLELGKHGEVRDGEWQGPGRSLARGEVEGLEQVVSMLGGEDGGTNIGTAASSSLAQNDDRMDES
ncbi:Mis12 protein-domain-containing protein [Xylaria arbuscula]|nr:Mis12 protein-domain-containing protein [Xylaria arbuscula]